MNTQTHHRPVGPRRVIVFGATGTIGRATAKRLLTLGHETVCVVRPSARETPAVNALELAGAAIRFAEPTNANSVRDSAFKGEPFDAVVSCIASRTGAPEDAWAIDHDANVNILTVAVETGTPRSTRATHFIMLSAICVQKPKLAFQAAKRAFEEKLIGSGLTWSIVRPTAFFKSMSGQAERIRSGKPFLVFGDGDLTACKPISDNDLAAFIVTCLDDKSKHNAVLPIGGPGPALTPREQGALLFKAFGKPAKFSRAPVWLLDVIISVLSFGGIAFPKLMQKAELARIGRYYATESMLLYDHQSEFYDAARTPEFGDDTLAAHYNKIARGEVTDDRGEHAVF
jgi:divinyl chlorophyllide a 8-vinyl-reductase